MKLFTAFSQQAPNRVFISIVSGAIAGISYAFLIPIVLGAININPDNTVRSVTDVNTFLTLEVSNTKIAALFLFFCVLILATRTLSQVLLTRVSIEFTTKLRMQLYEQIMAAKIAQLEAMGSSKLIAAITTDVGRIVMGARMLPDVLINIVTIVGLLGFLFYLNTDIFWFVIKCITFGVITYQLPMLISARYFARSRRRMDELQESIRGLIYGAKELKLSEVRSSKYLEDVLLDNEFAVRDADRTGFTIARTAANYGDMISFFVIGIVAFIFANYRAISSEELVGIVMALLYITAPISIVVNTIPQIMIAKVSLNKVEKLFGEIPSEEISQDVKGIEPWNKIIFKDVSYQYQSNDATEGFTVGPVSFSIEKSAVTFIVGGNGSGKSTLSKLITLHYEPASGSISFGPTALDASNIKSCRQTVTAIYSDYYLFDRLLDVRHANHEVEIDRYLTELGIDSKVSVEEGKFSTLQLSDGQKRRLALLVAYLEDKELYLFDEWAADQDPVFKEFFYHNVLSDLKRKGKAVVVISHDDRYFHMADKILVMEDGQMKDQTAERRADGLHAISQV